MPYDYDDYHSSGRPYSVSVVVGLLFMLFIFFFMIYTIYSIFNYYYLTIDYMKDDICQQKEMNVILKDISTSLKQISTTDK